MNKKKIFAVVLVLALGLFLVFENLNSRKVEKETPSTGTEIGTATPTYPNGQNVTLVVPWAAGGVTDIAARGFAQCLSKEIGTAVTVVNTPGASGYVGTQQALENKPDGLTLIFSAETPATFRVMGTGEISYEKDLSVIQLMVSDAKVVVVDKTSPYNTMEELVAAIKKNPNKITMSYTGPGASGHIQGLLYKLAGLEINDVPLGSGSAALTALFSGTVDFTNANLATVIEHIKSGQVRALAVFSDKGIEAEYGSIPPLTAAMPELSEYMPFYFPNCIAVDKDVPQETKLEILAACQRAVASDEWKTFAQQNGYLSLTDITMDRADAYWQEWQSIVSYLLYDNKATTINPEDLGIKRTEK
ncbi:MAG: tripartite tricarboxylate transporter substrate binding protein [Oscillospiraceae bacterium]